ncbi:MAG: hypothetical protein DM484_07035 [Candidatus Methylumidiphilus alinenensis]|uniref:Uncharacterized protein n=1 Tax=Candidatus Methylumidiphilus alinenensis TaxID=2202197 RepID=A0A2W4THP4_9GAMM|nr:MAG: hypothetical protein DM484_07035 [Candidatus Methylumidiphilus alinenensis]
MNDIWAEDIGITTVKTPVAILKEQASLLGRKTQNLVVGEVISSSQDAIEEPKITQRFNIKAPALGNYRYNLFSISHGIDIYPLTIYLENSIVSELATTNLILGSHNPRLIRSEEEFLGILNRILKSKRTKQVVHALLAQCLESGEGEQMTDIYNESKIDDDCVVQS